MRSTGQFVAQILESSAGGFAGLAASLLLERHPEIAKRYEPDAFGGWKEQLRHWLSDLSAALHLGEPALFADRMRWMRRAFAARQAPAEDLRSGLEALRDILRERLPAASAEIALPAIEGALDTLSDADVAESLTGDTDEPPARSALAYLEAILRGEPREAVEQVLRAVDGGASIQDVYLNVLIPAQREAGRMWQAGELSIAEEHVVTVTTQRTMTLLCERGRSTSNKDRTVLLACVAGNVHDIGVRAAADFFEMAGWRTINLGADVPEDEIARSVMFFDADVVVLAATLDPHLKLAQRAIDRIRSLEDCHVKIIVGGPAFERVPDLWREIGADGYSARVDDVEPLGCRLTRS